MTYAVDLGPVRKDLRALDDKTRRRVLRAVMALEVNPRPPGAKKLRGESELWRVRVGDYRILYSIEETRLVVLVVKIGIAGRSIAASGRVPRCILSRCQSGIRGGPEGPYAPVSRPYIRAGAWLP